MKAIKFGAVTMAFFAASLSQAADYTQSVRLRPGDYLLRSQDQYKDPVFDNYKTIDLSASLGVGSDCGRIDVKGTLQSSLRNVLDAKYFGDMGRNILAASPMLLTCYMSPTWCAILKHSQVNAHWLSQMRMDQCSIVDKYVDSRTEDFYRERQSCVRQAIERNGGDLERAMDSCQKDGVFGADLASWAGGKPGEKVAANRLIDSSAQWAGLTSPEAQGSLNLVKALVGDTVVSRGNISVEYGENRRSALSARTYLQSIEKDSYERLCLGIVPKIANAGGAVGSDQLITDAALRQLAPGYEAPLIDRQTLRSLMLMPPRQRELACHKLSDAVAMTTFSAEINRSLDLLTTLSQNPNLPDNRRAELEQKRKALKDSVEMAVSLNKQKNEPINEVLAQINHDGAELGSRLVNDSFSDDASRNQSEQIRASFMDCSDGVLCATGGGQ